MSRLTLKPERIIMLGDVGETIFTTEQATMACLGKFTGTLNTSSHAPEASLSAFHDVDHDIGPAPAGATAVIAWGKISTPTAYIAAGRPFAFSESRIFDGSAFWQSGFAQFITTFVFFSCVLTAGRVVIRESYITHSNGSSPVFSGVTIPAYSLQYDIRPIAFVGGF